MLNLKNFFKNHFDTQQISDDNLKKFAEDHLQRLSANNVNNQYDALLLATQSVYDKFHSLVRQEDQVYAQQQGKTLATDNILLSFVETLSRKEGLVRSEFGKDAVEYQEFFPQGMDEYHQISKTNAEVLMDRIIQAGNRHIVQLGQGFVTTFSDIYNKYLAARQAQLQTIGKVSSLKSDTEQARLELTEQLMQNLLMIAANHVGSPERLDDYFDQSIIRRANSKNNKETEIVVSENLT